MTYNRVTILDNLDIFLIKEIYERRLTGTRVLAKDYFFKDSRERNLCEKIDSKDMLINGRLKSLSKLGLVEISIKKGEFGKNRREYSLTNSIIIKKFKFKDKLSKSILLKIDGRWIAFELDVIQPKSDT